MGLPVAILVVLGQPAEPWSRLRQGTAIVLWLAVGILLVTRLAYDEVRQPQPVATGTTQRPAAVTAPAPGCRLQGTEDAPYLPDGAVLADGGTDVRRCFSARSPWHLEATGTDGQLCDTSV